MDEAKVLELAREAGFYMEHTGRRVASYDQVIAFARLVASAEREACAKVCDHYASLPYVGDGEAGAADGAEFLADAIRSRTE